uniref:Homocysteine-responsive endoplasmic reticulum-resident ubiquitin-like domain member 1 protein n=1 Tax=Callorhinchus milii TaxID=7868 RepID=V9KLV9_CALMI
MQTHGPPGDGEVTLTIKTPSQRCGDHTVWARLSWTVRRLKTQLYREHPNHPTEQEQRLIYFGKLLLDDLLLSEVLQKEEQYHILHMVCNLRTSLKSPQPERTMQEGSVPTASGQENLTVPVTVPVTVPAEGLRHRGQTAYPWPYGAVPVGERVPMPEGMSGLAAYNLYSSQQILWFQQMYVRQYYMQYQAAVAAQAAANSQQLQQPVVTPGPPAGLPAQPPLVTLPVDHHVPLPAANEPPANQNLRMNAQGGPVMDDEEELNRDWLDWMYLAARASFFFSIIYFYSSLSRVVLVMSAMILVYLHHTGWFLFRRRVPNNDPPAPGNLNQANQAAPQDQEPRPEEDQDLVNRSESSESDRPEPGEPPASPDIDPVSPATDPASTDMGPISPDSNPAPTPGTERSTIVNTAWVFLKTFFASLIPEGQGAAVN